MLSLDRIVPVLTLGRAVVTGGQIGGCYRSAGRVVSGIGAEQYCGPGYPIQVEWLGLLQ